MRVELGKDSLRFMSAIRQVHRIAVGTAALQQERLSHGMPTTGRHDKYPLPFLKEG